MKKFLKPLFILLCLFIISFSSVYAVDISMDINNINEVSDNNINNTQNSTVQNTSNYSPKISTTQTSEDFSLSVSDIINIILISVGIVLILLAVAILLKIR